MSKTNIQFDLIPYRLKQDINYEIKSVHILLTVKTNSLQLLGKS